MPDLSPVLLSGPGASRSRRSLRFQMPNALERKLRRRLRDAGRALRPSRLAHPENTTPAWRMHPPHNRPSVLPALINQVFDFNPAQALIFSQFHHRSISLSRRHFPFGFGPVGFRILPRKGLQRALDDLFRRRVRACRKLFFEQFFALRRQSNCSTHIRYYTPVWQGRLIEGMRQFPLSRLCHQRSNFRFRPVWYTWKP